MKISKMNHRGYLMESSEETLRLDLKTDGKTIEYQATWAGIKPGMRVADLGSIFTNWFNRMVRWSGSISLKKELNTQKSTIIKRA